MNKRKDDSMKGIIMAGGEGSRLRPLTCDLPKPMVPVMNKPVMTYSIGLLKRYGISEIGVTLQYLPEQIQDYFQDGSNYGVHLNYFIEETPLGTAGSVKNAGDFLDEPFVVISGDALTDINLEKAIHFHKQNRSMATLVLKRVEVPLEFGVVVTDPKGSITRFLEKPNWGEVFSDTVNTGIYILDPSVLDYLEAGKKFDFSQDLFPMLLKDKQPMYGYITNEYWCDIGNPQTYLSAHYDMLAKRVHHNFDGKNIGNGVWIGKGVKIDDGAVLEGPCFIGDYSTIEKDAHIGPYTVIGTGCNIEKGASIKRSVLWNHVLLGEKTSVRGASLCNKVETCSRVSVFEGAVIGDSCQLKTGAAIKPQVKIWPHKTVEEGNIVNSNIIWGTRVSRTLFGKDGIYGSVNIELTPQTIARIGAAFGAFLNPGKRVAVSCDSYTSSGMLKHGLISGLLSAGIEVFDLGYLTTPVLGYAVRRLGLDSGVHLFAKPDKPSEVRLHFLDSIGCSLSPSAERKIENLYIRDDFQRQKPDGIKRVNSLVDIPVFYIRSLMDSIDTKKIREKNYRVLIETNGSRLGNYIMHRVLEEAGCSIVKYQGQSRQEIKKTGYDLTCKLDYNCETVSLADENGVEISKELQNALIGLLYLKDKPDGKMAVPYTAPDIFNKLADDYNCEIIRTKSSKQALMREVYGTKLFSLYFDGIALLMKLLERMALDEVALSQLVEEIPKFHMIEKEIPCPWTQKGTVMRTLIEEESSNSKTVELFEGIRINHDNGWALILPDSDEPVCRVYSEGHTEEFAEELAVFYENRIREIQSQKLMS